MAKRGRPAKNNDESVEETKLTNEEVTEEITEEVVEEVTEDVVEDVVEEVTEDEEENVGDVEEITEEVVEEITEEVVEEEVTILANRISEEITKEDKLVAYNKSKFLKDLEVNKPYRIKQHGQILANYSAYLQVTAFDDHFMLFNKKYSYDGIVIEAKNK
jgi:NCAIR mutase (PurE)-related protein